MIEPFVAADLRRPALEQLIGMEPAPGLSEILAAARQGDTETAGEMIVEPATSASEVDALNAFVFTIRDRTLAAWRMFSSEEEAMDVAARLG